MMIFSFLKEAVNLWMQMAPFLLLGLVIAGILHVFIGKDFISRQLGKTGIVPIIKATILGVPLPVCSCGIVPLASFLKKDGAHKSNVLSFLVSTPTTGIDSILATYSLLGPVFTIFRPLAAMLSGVTVGGLDYLLERVKERKGVIPAKIEIQDRRESRRGARYAPTIREFLRYSFFEIPQDIGRWLILGTLLGAAIASFVPKDLVDKYFMVPWDFFIALIVGIPLYVCATGSIPVAVSLMQKGFSPGAGLVFLIVGPATNIMTLAFVRAKMGRKSFYLYLTSIVAVSVILGVAFNFIWFILGSRQELISGAGAKLPIAVRGVSGIVLFIVVFSSLLRRKVCPTNNHNTTN
jgi:uncharacterized membrane protein YraQ (UPF0718 family)